MTSISNPKASTASKSGSDITLNTSSETTHETKRGTIHKTNNETKQPLHSRALYRTYRPSHFDQVAGQDHVVSLLTSQIAQGNIGHAYIFYGTRGTGKTSVARIFANEIGTHAEDIYEIDAASQTSVDNIRELNDAVYTLPLSSPYKVYILDEVHMLSKAAFNAFLKTLEEPPKHVVFILATTEPEKLPETILSRCQIVHFKTPDVPTLAGLVKRVAEQEGYHIEDSATQLIGQVAQGAYRDALVTLQKVLSQSTGPDISVELVERVTGRPQEELVQRLVGLVVKDCGINAAADTASQIELAILEAKSESVAVEYLLQQIIEGLLARTFDAQDVRTRAKIASAAMYLVEHTKVIHQSFDPYVTLHVALIASVGERG